MSESDKKKKRKKLQISLTNLLSLVLVCMVMGILISMINEQTGYLVIVVCVIVGVIRIAPLVEKIFKYKY